MDKVWSKRNETWPVLRHKLAIGQFDLTYLTQHSCVHRSEANWNSSVNAILNDNKFPNNAILLRHARSPRCICVRFALQWFLDARTTQEYAPRTCFFYSRRKHLPCKAIRNLRVVFSRFVWKRTKRACCNIREFTSSLVTARILKTTTCVSFLGDTCRMMVAGLRKPPWRYSL